MPSPVTPGRMNDERPSSRVPPTARPWISLWLTIHLFSLAVCLSANLSPSELQRRALNVLAPYTVGLHQDYGGVLLEMTRGLESDYPHEFQVHEEGSDESEWRSILPPRHALAAVDHRWRTFQRLTALAAGQQNEELVHLLLEQSVAAWRETQTDTPVDRVRLIRRVALSYAADQAKIAGELPISELNDRVLYECRVIALSGDRIKLLPVLESTRTAKSLIEAASAEDAEDSTAAPDTSSSPDGSSTSVLPGDASSSAEPRR